MEESQTAKIEAKLKKMIKLHTQSQKENENRRVKNVPHGIKVIRLRKGSPDKHIM